MGLWCPEPKSPGTQNSDGVQLLVSAGSLGAPASPHPSRWALMTPTDR